MLIMMHSTKNKVIILIIPWLLIRKLKLTSLVWRKVELIHEYINENFYFCWEEKRIEVFEEFILDILA